jgi:hypothetical protein
VLDEHGDETPNCLIAAGASAVRLLFFGPKGRTLMIHYSCDRCGRPIDPQEELRYVVRIEVEAVMEPLDGDVIDDDDRDHLMELHEILERADDAQNPLIGDGVYQRSRFDLCPACHRKFMQNPVGREASKQLDFSQN